jgi:N12 class adenine-specific DNA methylase
MKLDTLKMQSDNRRTVRNAGKDNTMVTEDHRHAGRKKRKVERLVEMEKERDKELYELKADIEKLELRMRQDRRLRWMRELPIKKEKAKWPVKELMVRG